MNKIIVFYVKDTENKGYNPMFKYSSVELFQEALRNNEHVPKMSDIVLEAYIDDNLVDIGNTFEVTLSKIKLILGLV